MPPVGPSLRLGANVLAVVATAAFAVLLWRRRSEPTVRPLLGLSVVLLVAVSTHFALTELLADENVWVLAAFNFTTVGMCLWFLFTVRYTGRGKRTAWLATAFLFVLPAMVLAVSLAAVRAGPGLRPYVDAFLGVFMLFFTSIVVVGVFFVVAESVGENAFPFRESLLLSGGATALALSPLAVSIFVAPLAVPLTLGTASGLFAVTVRRYPLLETLPVARVAGRDRIIDEMTDAVVVVDRGRAVRDLNAAAERIFGVDRETALDRPLSTVLPAIPDPDAIADDEGLAQVRTADGVALSVTAERVTDARDRHVGDLLVCRDVTDRRNRERRLTVLNQLLVGALRERMTTVAGDARSIIDGSDRYRDPIDPGESASPGPGDPAGSTDPGTREADPAAVGDRIWTETTHLTRLVTYAREIERALSDGDRTATTDVREAIRPVANRADEGVEVVVDLPTDPVPVGVDDALLRTALALLVEDARSRGADRVELDVVEDAGGPAIHVVDCRPDRGSGTDDDADSGVAVRMARLAVEHFGGEVSATTDGGRRRVAVELPAPAPDTDEVVETDPGHANRGGEAP